VAELQKEGAGADGPAKVRTASVRAIARRLGRDPRHRRVISENLSEDHVKDLLRADADPERKRTTSGYRPRPPSSLVLVLACWGRKAREWARYTEAVFDVESIHNLIEESGTSRVNVSNIEGVERDLARAVKATKRQLAAVQQIKEAVAARQAETVPDGPGPGSAGEPRRPSEPGGAGPDRRPRRRPDRSGR
jgi:hypothetical protein